MAHLLPSNTERPIDVGAPTIVSGDGESPSIAWIGNLSEALIEPLEVAATGVDAGFWIITLTSAPFVARNVADAAEPPRKARAEMRVWTPEESAAFLATAKEKGSPNWALYVTALGTGMRRGELLALKWTDLDPIGKAIIVQRTLVAPGVPPMFKEPKSGRGRRVEISESLLAVLREHARQQKEWKECEGDRYEDYGLIFAQATGRPIRANNLVRREYKELIKQAGVPYIPFHALRHTHATDLLRQGEPPKVVAERLGHSSISVTMDIYSHVLPSMQRSAASVIDALLNGP